MSPTVTIHEDALENPHAHRPDPHYRLYLLADGVPTVICVQDFDYPDYEANRFLTADAYDDEADADRALSRLVTGALDPTPNRRDDTACRLALLGAPMSRAQAVEAYATRAHRPGLWAGSRLDAESLAYQLRTHAFEQDNADVTAHLRLMADRIDGGVGVGAHHGCPDPSIPAAECDECTIVLDVEVTGAGRAPSIFHR